jgi:hypothetical protein
MTETGRSGPLAKEIERCLEEPRFFADILSLFSGTSYRAILEAWSEVRTNRELARDVHGRYWLETRDTSSDNKE